MNQYPNLLLTLLLTCTLIPPYILKIYHPRLEPYPAIILPSGARKVNLGRNDITFNRTSIWAKHEKNDIWTRIDAETFLSPIPPHYLYEIARNSFGLDSSPGKTNNLLQKYNILTNKVTPSEVKEGKRWLSQKLVQSEYKPDKIMITLEQMKFDITTRKITTIKRNDEKVIRLN